MRPLLHVCIFFLITSVVSPVGSIHAQTANPIIVSLNNVSDAVLHSKDTGARDAAEASGRLGEAIDEASIEQLRESVPTILQSVGSTDPTIRSVALIAVVAMNQRLILESLRTGERKMLVLLNPYIPAIAAHLTDPDQRVRSTAVLDLRSFGSPINDAFPPMIAYLKRDDAITTIGSAIVFELAARGSQRSDVEDAIIAYLNRPDQTTSELKNSIQAIAAQNSESTPCPGHPSLRRRIRPNSQRLNNPQSSAPNVPRAQLSPRQSPSSSHSNGSDPAKARPRSCS